MRPWSTQELRDRLGMAGFSNVETQPAIARASGDRLLVAAQRGRTTACEIKPHRDP